MGFEAALDSKLLSYIQPRIPGETYRAEPGKTLSVVEWDGQLWGLDGEDPEAEPVPISPEDLARYRLSLDAVGERLQQANELQGEPCRLTERLYYLGWREHEGVRIGVVLALLLREEEAVRSTLSLPSHVSAAHGRCLLVCPSFTFRDQGNARRLEDAGIALSWLNEDDVWRMEWRALVTATRARGDAEKLLVIENGGMVVRYSGQDVKLTPTEQRVLLALAQRPGKPVAVGHLGDAGWEGGPSDFDAVRRVIGQLRAKFKQARERAAAVGTVAPGELIETRRGRHGTGSAYELTLESRQIELSDQTET